MNAKKKKNWKKFAWYVIYCVFKIVSCVQGRLVNEISNFDAPIMEKFYIVIKLYSFMFHFSFF